MDDTAGMDKLETEQGKEYTCPNCGGMMVFDISSQLVKCEQCDSLTEIATSGIQEYDLQRGIRSGELDSTWNEQMSLIRCESCGSEIVVPQDELVAHCEYCGSTKVLVKKAEAGIPPEGIIPFVVDRHGAGEAFRKWISRRFWAPRALKRAFQEDKIEAVYLPYWTFDAQVDAKYSGEGGEVYYVTEGSGENRRRVRHVRWYPVRGRINRFFDDVLISARRVRDKLIAHVENFGTQKLLPFSTAYLSGYKAEKYATTPAEAFEEAKKKMIDMLEDQARSEVLRHYDEVRAIDIIASFTQTTYKHILVPFWFSSYMYMDKPYRFVINAQSGKVHGEAPVSKVKVALAVVVALVVFVIIYLSQNSV